MTANIDSYAEENLTVLTGKSKAEVTKENDCARCTVLLRLIQKGTKHRAASLRQQLLVYRLSLTE